VVRNQEGDKDLVGERVMLEQIKTFFGKLRGLHGQRKVIVEEGLLWKCTKCGLIFLNKKEGEKHDSENRC
jgi:hypothetical protein